MAKDTQLWLFLPPPPPARTPEPTTDVRSGRENFPLISPCLFRHGRQTTCFGTSPRKALFSSHRFHVLSSHCFAEGLRFLISDPETFVQEIKEYLRAFIRK